jgi:demethylmenaquinone methyltransferase/2-methoxy-6-polyprenyl-1,4-benzoquinol methylase
MPGLRSLYGWYFRAVLPRIGRLISRHGDAYSYLPASVAQFPPPEQFMAIVRQSGFRTVRRIPLSLVIVALYVAVR